VASLVGAPAQGNELIDRLAELAKGSDGDVFKVKIDWKERLGQPANLILSFADVTLKHLRDCEEWLPPLVGGSGEGTFILRVSHKAYENGYKDVGFIESRVSGKPRLRPNTRDIEINWAKMDDAAWSGPNVVTHPPRPQKDGEGGASTVLSIAQGAADRPARPAAAEQATATDLQKERAELDRQREAIEKSRREMELAAQRKDHEIELKELRQRLDEVAKGASKPQGLDPALVEFGKMLLQQQMEARKEREERRREEQNRYERERKEKDEREERDRREAKERDERREKEERDRRADEARRAEERARRDEEREQRERKEADERRERERKEEREARERELKLMEKMTDRKDPGLEAAAKMMESMSKVQQQASDMQASLITAMTNMALTIKDGMTTPDDNPAWLKAMEMGLDTISKSLGRKDGGQSALRGLPSASSAGADGDGGGEGEGGGEGGAGAAPQLPEALRPVEELLVKMAPPKDVAVVVVASYEQKPEFAKIVEEYKSDLQALFTDYFGDWVGEDVKVRAPYAEKVMHAIASRVQERKLEIEKQSPPPKAS
jgi:hypothetical protein